MDVVVDNAGNLYIADLGNGRIRKVTPSGTVSTAAGTGVAGFSGDGGTATAAQLSYPMGAGVDSFGDLYIADTPNHRIRKVTFHKAATSLVITSASSLLPATIGTPYSVTLVGLGGNQPYTWGLSAGSMPSGLSLASSSGVISGMPLAAGSFNFTVRLTDATAGSVTKLMLPPAASPKSSL